MEKLRLGVVPIKRTFLPMEAAVAQKNAFMPVIREIKRDWVEIVDVDELTENGIAFTYEVIAPIVQKLRDAKIDALFLPFCDFGEESVAAGIASALKVPTLVWGPRDTEPNSDVTRGRDTQCGIIAATKVLARCGVTYSYIVSSPTDSEQFRHGFETFLRASMVVKTMKHLRVGQIGNRPEPFMSVIANEGELLERFGIQVTPIPVTTIAKYTDEILAQAGEDFQKACADYTARVDCSPMDSCQLTKMLGMKDGAAATQRAVAMKMAIRRALEEKDCACGSMDCWPSAVLLKGLPCLAVGELADEGLPISCEGDINGAVTLAILNACAMGDSSQFFADLTIRHPENDNAELLWHCGPFPYSLKNPDSPARLQDMYQRWELKPGDITLCRFDSIGGSYSLFAGEGHTTTGPETTGTYVWFETDNWEAWEERLVFGPYIHHVAGAYGAYADALREAARYLGITFDAPDAPGPKSLR